MRVLKSFLSGLVVSFIGSIPFGYLNIIAAKLYIDQGSAALLAFIIGIVCVEGIVIISTLRLAQWLISKKKLIFWLEIFSILFLLILAANFYFSPGNTQTDTLVSLNNKTLLQLILAGVLFSSLNFIQIPFWAGWNIYLLNNKYLTIGKLHNLLFVSGALLGTSSAIYIFSIVLFAAVKNTNHLMTGGMTYILPIIFLVLALFQSFKMLKKYNKI